MRLSKEEKNRRIALDFNKNIDEILLEISDIYTDVSEKQIKIWEKNRVLEFLKINGEKRYFRRAARNLFRIDNEAKKLFLEKFGDEKATRNELLKNCLTKIINSQTPVIKHFIFTFRLNVKANSVPEGKTIRCWLPFPHQNVDYQKNIKLIDVNSPKFQISENSPHQTIFLEKNAKKDEKTVFEVKFEFETSSFFAKKNKKIIQKNQCKKYLSEQKPHIVFSKKIRSLSSQIIENEEDNYQKAKKIFTWISNNITWAAAREYSTIKNIPEYVLKNLHGDCGQVTLLFIALCRLNNIPARWLSGFMLHTGSINLHDWAEIFIENYGWIPIDVSFGLQKWAKTDDLRYFYFGNIDAFRLIINNDISAKFYPKKNYPRSETIDFQRGEVEWCNGNLYFDKFDYEFFVEEKTL
jgi:hypothetical protein